MQDILTRVQSGTTGEGGSYRSNFSVVASETSNSIIVRGDEIAVERAKKVAFELDQTDPVRDNIRVISLNNADAELLVPILERVGATMAAQKAPGDAAAAGPTIAHHQPTNSLVISADHETLLAMDKVIVALDVRRAQVLVEAIIVEMSDDAARELGLQLLLSGKEGSNVPFATTNFSRAAPNLLALTGALLTDGFQDLDENNAFRDAAIGSLVGSAGLTLGVGGQDGDTLFGVILNAVENDTNSRILSTPFGMTLDNATSSLIVGQEVPVTTGEVLGDANTNPFRTVERKEIGVKLEVTPRIGESDTVRLDIVQEVSSIFGSVGNVTQDLILDKREIKTSVVADDGEIIVLGGLVEQTDTQVDSRVPLLGSIPVLGRLFRSEGKQSTRTNLMVFIKPTIVRNLEDVRSSTAQKYLYIRADEIMRGVEASESIDSFVGTVLGTPPPQ
jgi:general secretion pathway protein D